MQFIDLKIQQERIRPQIDAAIARVLDHGRYIMGPELHQLEEKLAEYVGVKHAIGCSSGSDALLLALMANGVGPGDAIFTTPFSFFATCEMIAITGATPVFVDVDYASHNIDPKLLRVSVEKVLAEEKLQPRAVLPVDLFGLPADYTAIKPVAEEYGLFVLQDAAQSFGATCNDQIAPGHGDIGTTSFFPAKPLGCYGDGGAIFTEDDSLAQVIRSLLIHGKGASKYDNVRVGLNARLDTIQAAVLLEKLRIFPEELEMRQHVAARYTDAILQDKQNPYSITPPTASDECRSVWAQYTVKSPRRDALQARLQEEGIPTAIYYERPMQFLDAMTYLGYGVGDLPVSEQLSKEVLSVPMHPYLSKEHQDRVIGVLTQE